MKKHLLNSLSKKSKTGLMIILFCSFGLNFYSQTVTLLEESFESPTGFWINIPYDAGCDFFRRDNSPPINGCHSEVITGLEGSFMWATEDIGGERFLEFLPVNSEFYENIQITFKAGVSRYGQQRWDWQDQLYIEYNMDDGGWIVCGLIMGGGVAIINSAIGEMAIDLDMDPTTNGPGSFIPGSEITLNMADITFDIPATGSSLKVRVRMDQDGGSEEIGLDHFRITGDLGGVSGCTDIAACNYDPLAEEDDGSCSFPGCNDPIACNFDPIVGCDDGTCDYVTCAGCITVGACNYDPSATIDNGSCEFLTCAGCTTVGACNYDPTSTIDDGSCEFLSCAGCLIEIACNYDPSATIDDGSCDFTSCAGCTSNVACNYNSSATIDDGSCDYSSCAGCLAVAACNYQPLATLDDGSCEYLSCAGCTYTNAPEYDPSATLDNGTCTIPGGSCTGDANNDGVVNIIDLAAVSSSFGNSCE